jgi:hypothetical protein
LHDRVTSRRFTFTFIGLADVLQTLQELIAPRTVNFFSREGKHLGNKRALEQLIHEITGIPVSALQNSPLDEFSLDERMSWMRTRHTTRKEDKVYSLLGIFGIFLAPIYGEGEQYARNRFRRELDAVSRPISVHANEIMKNKVEAVQGMQYAQGHVESCVYLLDTVRMCEALTFN